MPGGTASNIVAYIARGDMPLSVMMTTASTLMAVFTTPLLTSLLVVGGVRGPRRAARWAARLPKHCV